MLKAVAIRVPSDMLFLHGAFQRADLILVDEHAEVAGMGEVDLRGEGNGTYPVVAFLRHEEPARRKQRARRRNSRWH